MLRKNIWIVSVFIVFLSTSIVFMNSNIEMLAKEFVDQLVKGEYEAAYLKFDSTMKKALPVKKLEETWQSVISQCGSFKRQVRLRNETQPELTTFFVTCEFEKAVLDIKVVFNDQSEISGLWFVPGKLPPMLPSEIKEMELSVNSQDWTLPATLTLPSKKGAYPVVILVHGSGPNDRDETIGPNKPFHDLAWGLAKNGIAVLRYDKRTKVYGASAFKKEVTVQAEVIDDVLSAISLVKTIPEINKEQIFILGHSLGGMLIPRIASQSQDAKGFIVMAGPCRPLEDLILEQCDYLFKLDGNLSDKERENLDLVKKQVEKVKSPELSLATPVIELPNNTPASYWLDLRDYNPAILAKEIMKPFLILQGERDYQVTIADFKIWKDTLSGRKDVEFKLYPGLNHLFIKGQGKPNPEEYYIPGHIDKAVINDISSWIKKTIK